MKRLLSVSIVLSLLVLSYSPAHAGISVHHVDGQIAPDTIAYGVPITFYMLWDGSEFPGCAVINVTNAFTFNSPTSTPLNVMDAFLNPEIDWESMLDGGFWTDVAIGWDGYDTVGFEGFRLFGTGIPDTLYEIAYIIQLAPFPQSELGGEICIDNSGFGAHPWKWGAETCGMVIPSWSGPHCYTIVNCCSGIRGDANLDGGIDVADLTFLIDYLFQGGPDPLCHAEADVNASTGVAITDLTYLVDYLFRGGLAPSACPEE